MQSEGESRVCPAPPGHARRVVAEFRAAVTCYSDDPDIRRLVDGPRIVVGGFDAKPADKHSRWWGVSCHADPDQSQMTKFHSAIRHSNWRDLPRLRLITLKLLAFSRHSAQAAQRIK